MLLKTDLIKTNKNDTIPFQKLTKKSHGKGFKPALFIDCVRRNYFPLLLLFTFVCTSPCYICMI